MIISILSVLRTIPIRPFPILFNGSFLTYSHPLHLNLNKSSLEGSYSLQFYFYHPITQLGYIELKWSDRFQGLFLLGLTWPEFGFWFGEFYINLKFSLPNFYLKNILVVTFGSYIVLIAVLNDIESKMIILFSSHHYSVQI